MTEEKKELSEEELAQKAKDEARINSAVKFLVSERGLEITGQALVASIRAHKGRMPEMWRESKDVKDLQKLMREFKFGKEGDITHKSVKYYVKCEGETIAEYDDSVHNSIMAVEVAQKMHTVDSDNYYSASVETTFSPVLIDGGSKDPTEIAIWSSDSVSSEDEFNFVDDTLTDDSIERPHLIGGHDIFHTPICANECWCKE